VSARTTAQVGRRLRSVKEAGKRDRVGVFATIVGVLLVLVAVLAPLLPIDNPTHLFPIAQQSPSLKHIFGTDELGRDVLSRTVWGARQSLSEAVLGTALAALVGVPAGVIAGYFGRWSATAVMRLTDIFLALPGLLLALVIVTILGAGTTTVVIALGISFAPILARLAYAPTRAIRERGHIAAARTVGCTRFRIMRRHVLPILGTELIVVLSSTIGWALLSATTLDFLGFGVHPPTPDWGADLSGGVQYLQTAWWISAAPGLAITLTILIANYAGDFTATMLDPLRMQGEKDKMRDASEMIAGAEQ